MIADGVYQGYLEVRLAMRRGHGSKPLRRPWAQGASSKPQVRPARPNDGSWARDLASDMASMGMVVAGPSPDGPRPN